MKALVLLLFCATMVQAQGLDTTRYPDERLRVITFGPSDYLGIVTDDLLFDYAQECYADSTTQRTHVGKVGESCLVDWYCLIESHYQMVTTHRPVTFSGFIEYLRRKKP